MSVQRSSIRYVPARLRSVVFSNVNPAAIALTACVPLVWVSLSMLWRDSTGQVFGELTKCLAHVENVLTLVLGVLILSNRWWLARDVFIAIVVLAASLHAIDARRASLEKNAQPVAEHF